MDEPREPDFFALRGTCSHAIHRPSYVRMPAVLCTYSSAHFEHNTTRIVYVLLAHSSLPSPSVAVQAMPPLVAASSSGRASYRRRLCSSQLCPSPPLSSATAAPPPSSAPSGRAASVHDWEGVLYACISEQYERWMARSMCS